MNALVSVSFFKDSTTLAIIILNTGDLNKSPLGVTFESINSSFTQVFFWTKISS